MQHASGVDSGEECISSALNLFQRPYVDTSINHAYYTRHTPVSAISDSATSITIDVPQSEDFTDLNQSYFLLQTKIVKADGGALDAFTAPDAAGSGNSVGFINIPSSSMFSNINVVMGEQNLSDNYSTYPYLAYFQNLLNFSNDCHASLQQLAGFYEDKNFSSRSAHTAATDTGFKTRAQLTRRSHYATFVGVIHHGLFSQNRFLLPLMPISLEFMKASNSFVLKSDDTSANYKFQIKSLNMFIRRVKVKASHKLEIENQLLKEPCLLPLRHCSVKPLFIDRNTHSVSFENIFNSNSLPAFCCIALTTQAAYRGSYATDPFQFDHFRVTSMKITLDNETYPSPMGFTPDYVSTSHPDWAQEYFSLFYNDLKSNQGRLITLDSYKNGGYCMYFFTLGFETNEASDHVTPKRVGTGARLEITFDSGSTNEALTVLVYQERDEELRIHANRRVERDYFL